MTFKDQGVPDSGGFEASTLATTLASTPTWALSYCVIIKSVREIDILEMLDTPCQWLLKQNKTKMIFCVYVCLFNQITLPGSLSTSLSPAFFGCIATIGRIKGMQRNGGHWPSTCLNASQLVTICTSVLQRGRLRPGEIKAFAQSHMKLSDSGVHIVTIMVGSLRNVPESAHS